MPPTDLIRSVVYPASGWSSWFGPHYERPLPDSFPYGFKIVSPDAWGAFKRYTDGVLYESIPIQGLSFFRYRGEFAAPGSGSPAWMDITPVSPGVFSFYTNFFTPKPPLIYTYQGTTEAGWTLKRIPFSIPGPDDTMPGYPGRMGTTLEITPFNLKGLRIAQTIS